MLIDDIKKVFDPQQNSLLQKGNVRRWLAFDQYNLCAGRIAAFYLPGADTGQVGFFETIRDEGVAHELFRTAERWLQEHGCTGIEGPVNFGEKDRFWGLMTEGFESKGLYLDNFNPSYYYSYFHSFGFETKDTIYTYRLNQERIPAKKLDDIADWSEKKFGYTITHFKWDEKKRFAAAIHSIYTASFKAEKRIAHLLPDDIVYLLDQVKPLLNEDHCWLAFRAEVPVGFILFLKEPSPMRHQPGILKGFAFATIPAMRGKGVEMALCRALHKQLEKEERKYEIMLSGINACTARMNSLISKIGGEKIKVHQTFNYKIRL